MNYILKQHEKFCRIVLFHSKSFKIVISSLVPLFVRTKFAYSHSQKLHAFYFHIVIIQIIILRFALLLFFICLKYNKMLGRII